MSDATKNNDGLICISLWNPWANWVVLGWKTIETRLHTRFAGLAGKRIGIHAALKWDTENALLAARPFLTPTKEDRTREFLKLGGHVACTVFVREARWLTADDSRAAMIDCGGTRRFGLILEEPRIVPVCDESCVKGHQGIFRVPALAHLSTTPTPKAEV